MPQLIFVVVVAGAVVAVFIAFSYMCLLFACVNYMDHTLTSPVLLQSAAADFPGMVSIYLYKRALGAMTRHS